MSVRHLVYNKSWIGSEIWSCTYVVTLWHTDSVLWRSYESIIRVTKARARGAKDLPHIAVSSILTSRQKEGALNGRLLLYGWDQLMSILPGISYDGEINLCCTWANNNATTIGISRWIHPSSDRIWIIFVNVEWHMLFSNAWIALMDQSSQLLYPACPVMVILLLYLTCRQGQATTTVEEQRVLLLFLLSSSILYLSWPIV